VWTVNGAATGGAGGFGAGLAHRLDSDAPLMLTASVGAGFGSRGGNDGFGRSRGSNATVVGRVGIGGEF
jgi:hypothetical protein